MNTVINAYWVEAEGRYLGAEQLRTMETYMGSLPRRIQVYQELQSKEAALLDWVMERFQPTMPNLTRLHGPLAWERCRRDLSMVWRYCTMAYFLNDEAYLQDKLLYWMETIIKSFKMKDQCQVAYKLLLEGLSFVLTDEAQSVVKPYVRLAKLTLVN